MELIAAGLLVIFHWKRYELSPMVSLPILRISVLTLRPFTAEDAANVYLLASDKQISANMRTMPHPYPEGHAEKWIAGHAERLKYDEELNWAIVIESTDELIGAIRLSLDNAPSDAHLGYWIGTPYWGHGYATKATEAVIDYGFHELGLHRISAIRLERNVASGRVMDKLGMTYHRTIEHAVQVGDSTTDVVEYSVTREDYVHQSIPDMSALRHGRDQ